MWRGPLGGSLELGREDPEDPEEQSAATVMWLLGQMVMVPVAAFVYGMELLVVTMQGMQRATSRGMKVMVGDEAHAPPVVHRERAAEGQAASKEDVMDSTYERSSRDRDLQDDRLKLVRYKVLFVKREYEHAFPEREDLVPDNLDGPAFTAWKIAEFIQDLHNRRDTPVPDKWLKRKYPDERYMHIVTRSDGQKQYFLTGLDHDDKKYLRIYYEVLDRYAREKFKYEEQQIDVLREIRDKIPSGTAASPPPPPASPPGSGGGGTYASGASGGGAPSGGSSSAGSSSKGQTGVS